MTQAVGVRTLADVIATISASGLSPTKCRDTISAINRVCEMMGASPPTMALDLDLLRERFRKVRPAAHNVSDKTWSNLRSLFGAALEFAGVADRPGRGVALKDPIWGPLLKAVAHDQRISGGLAAFANWCAANGIPPDAVSDDTVQAFLQWLETRTLHPSPHDLVRRVPRIWNEACQEVDSWPKITLTVPSFRPPRRRLAWEALDEKFRKDADAYLHQRAEPDLFDDRPSTPTRALAPATVHLQREHLRVGASVLVESGVAVTSLADLVTPNHFKTVLRSYHERANGKPNGWLDSLVRTLIQVARYHVGVTAEELAELKRIASKLPPIPFDLTAKNKLLLRQLESENLRAKLFFLPHELMEKAVASLESGASDLVAAQVGIAVDFLLVAPLRMQNLIALNWSRHFSEPDGPRGRLVLHIPAEATKTKKRELIFEIPDDIARRLRWYRRHILARIGADPNGDLFVTERGARKSQETLSQQITESIERYVGIHMTPHQFRHVAAAFYLEDHPEDFETVKDLLGHSWSKTTRVYAGSSTRRAGRVYSKFILEQREALRLKRRPKRGRPTSGETR